VCNSKDSLHKREAFFFLLFITVDYYSLRKLMVGCKLQKFENHCHGVHLNAVSPVFILFGALK
jgi:hypothetical protein